MLYKLFYILARLWLTGSIYILAGAGYCFYGFLWIIRLAQSCVRKPTRVIHGIVLACAVMSGILHCSRDGQCSSRQIEIEIRPGQSLTSVSRMLADSGIVSSARGFKVWIKLRGDERSVQAGRYTFQSGEGIYSVARKMRHARPVEIVVTVFEGLTIEQTAARIAEFLEIDTSRFIELCADSAFAAALGIKEGSLEGYLFPDTYRFLPGVSEDVVIGRMTGRFFEVYNALKPDFSGGVELNRHETVILASIIEKEATLASERDRISGVFHNRLRLGHPLGADPTVRYMLRKFSGPLRVSELKNPSPYNTRIHRGLPPGPVCSPGGGALQAAVSPLKTKELYFVARWDGSGAHDFSVTQTEHDRKKHEARRRNERERKKPEESR